MTEDKKDTKDVMFGMAVKSLESVVDEDPSIKEFLDELKVFNEEEGFFEEVPEDKLAAGVSEVATVGSD